MFEEASDTLFQWRRSSYSGWERHEINELLNEFDNEIVRQLDQITAEVSKADF